MFFIFLFSVFSSLGAIDDASYTRVLNRYLDGGLVDYEGLKQDPKDLDRYLQSVKTVSREAFDTWDRHEQLALLINLYNAQTLKLIIDHYPLDSIKDIGGFFRGPWDLEIVELFGEKISLDELEHDIIRGEYEEPLIHFGLNCASIGCPDLAEKPYTGPDLIEQLEAQARLFLRDTNRNRFDHNNRIIYLSKLLGWYKKDFQMKTQTMLEYLLPYLPPSDTEKMGSKRYRIKYIKYDWSLNDG